MEKAVNKILSIMVFNKEFVLYKGFDGRFVGILYSDGGPADVFPFEEIPYDELSCNMVMDAAAMGSTISVVARTDEGPDEQVLDIQVILTNSGKVTHIIVLDDNLDYHIYERADF